MRQVNYEIIVESIKFGLPAIADKVIADFNRTVEMANKMETLLQQQAQTAQKAQPSIDQQAAAISAAKSAPSGDTTQNPNPPKKPKS